MLRLIAFFILDQLVDKNPTFLLKFHPSILALISLTMQLCFKADLQEDCDQNSESSQNINTARRKLSTRQKIPQVLDMC